ncbi:TPA: TauD/TfdA family dioxygenase [Enterobacter hormaechei subsp. xiangfangensis]|nr:TauD/TfdA family dioxygenase [Enterobacter hormaechei subsp. xiangfangensis]
MSDAYHLIEDDKAVWDAMLLNSKHNVALDIEPQQRDAILDHLKAFSSRASESLKASDFRCSSLDRLVATLRHRLQDGHGVVVIRGLPREQLSDETLGQLFWGLGLGLGRPVVQNALGARIGHVRNEKDNPTNRGYMSNRELGFHSDAFEIVGLMCLRASASGGLNQVVSGLAVYNQFVREQPELLEALFEGYYYATAERTLSEQPFTSYKIPVFSEVAGKVSSMCLGAYMRAAAKLKDTVLPAALDAGLKAFYEICNRPEFKLEFMLEPGEILFLNNYTTLHSRTEFQDDEHHQRHLLRLWIELQQGRPVVPALTARGYDYEQLFLERLSKQTV